VRPVSPDKIPRIGIVAGPSAASQLTAQCLYSVLTRIGHWIQQIDDHRIDESFDLLVFTSPQSQAALLECTRQPRIVYHPQHFAGPAATAPESSRVVLGGVELSSAFDVAAMAGDAITLDDEGGCLTVRTDDRTIESLPFFLTPDLQDRRVFWRCAEILAMHVGAALQRSEFSYADPWPEGYVAAFALTFDLDDLTQRNTAFESALQTAAPTTLFVCANQLHALPPIGANLEVACHGDVHVPFDNARTNEARIDTMWKRFVAAGFAPQGFSPPYLAYTSPRATLTRRFGYLRMGYMERELLFFPRFADGGIVSGVSFYPDHALKYVAPSRFHSMIERYLTWSRNRGFLATLCFHPALFPDAYRPYLPRQEAGVWRATMADIASWWRVREQTLVKLRDGDPIETIGLVLSREAPAARVRRLMAHDVDAVQNDDDRSLDYSRSGAGATVVYNPSDRIARDVQLPRGEVSRESPPGELRGHEQPLVEVNTKNGFHGCFYGRLGFEARLNGDATSLYLPFVAGNEYLVSKPVPRGRSTTRRVYARARSMIRHVVSRLTREARMAE
jgi:hypothetical protein